MLGYPVKANVLDVLRNVKFEFDWTKNFRVRVQKRKC